MRKFDRLLWEIYLRWLFTWLFWWDLRFTSIIFFKMISFCFSTACCLADYQKIYIFAKSDLLSSDSSKSLKRHLLFWNSGNVNFWSLWSWFCVCVTHRFYVGCRNTCFGPLVQLNLMYSLIKLLSIALQSACFFELKQTKLAASCLALVLGCCFRTPYAAFFGLLEVHKERPNGLETFLDVLPSFAHKRSFISLCRSIYYPQLGIFRLNFLKLFVSV